MKLIKEGQGRKPLWQKKTTRTGSKKQNQTRFQNKWLKTAQNTKHDSASAPSGRLPHEIISKNWSPQPLTLTADQSLNTRQQKINSGHKQVKLTRTGLTHHNTAVKKDQTQVMLSRMSHTIARKINKTQKSHSHDSANLSMALSIPAAVYTSTARVQVKQTDLSHSAFLEELPLFKWTSSTALVSLRIWNEQSCSKNILACQVTSVMAVMWDPNKL